MDVYVKGIPNLLFAVSFLFSKTCHIMDQFRLNPIRQNMERTHQGPYFAQPSTDQAIEATKDFGYAQIAYPQKSINQTKICQEENIIAIAQFNQCNTAPGRTYEINSDAKILKGFNTLNNILKDSIHMIIGYQISNIIRCDGSFHCQTNSYDQKDGSTLTRDFLILNSN
ncbi:unnamed protein product [Paramecium octaurelia]|uniref:Uncharacterized protein n=1 Tax=Paramecium octaurelia TaxID=43137 RepID=A0A8S1UCX6_PAROT|nr:unnamed protein product [Paramecium octaurelia]